MNTPTPRLVLEVAERGMPPQHWLDLTPEERREAVAGQGLPAFRAQQISRHVVDHFSLDPAGWTDLPAALRGIVAENWLPPLLEEVRAMACDGGDTVKTLWRLHGGSLVESVLMRYPSRATLCISSQAGCGMACPFCATGQGGLQRNLTSAEIVAQVLAGFRTLSADDGDARLSNIVFMGMGEPLANYPRLLRAIRTLLAPSPDGLGMSARGITVSTVGLVPRMRELAGEGLPLTLAVSLHAPDDELRDEIVPANNRWPLDDVLDAAFAYAEQTKRRVSIEYALIRDINDQAWRADLLARQLLKRGRSSGHNWGWVHVNLIPLNPTPGSKWTASRPADEQEFMRRLVAAGIPTTLRDTRGREIDGACGQLAAAEG